MSTPVQQQLTVSIPAWVPKAARVYLEHVENGRSIRAIARDRGCHASTIMRQVRRYEGRRDDLLIDLALRRLGRTVANGQKVRFGEYSMIHVSQEDQTRPSPHVPDDDEVRRVAPRILRRMNEAGACMAIARDMENAVVARETSDGRTLRTAVVERHIAEAMALNDWISVVGEGRITKYKI
ncbi:MAG: helix-turn-helix domain-containing protein, partial [Pseudomonadota bacterium]